MTRSDAYGNAPFGNLFQNRQLNSLRLKNLEWMALKAYIYGYPLVLMEVTKHSMIASGTLVNRFSHRRSFPNPDYTTIVRPNVDTLYSLAWLELTKEPVILKVPDTRNRFYLLEFLDAWTNVFASLGTRTTGNQAGTFAIAGPDWNGKLPEGIHRIDSPTNMVLIIGRIQTDGIQDYQRVHDLQNLLSLIPISQRDDSALHHQIQDSHVYTGKPNLNPVEQVSAMSASSFFHTMNWSMRKNSSWIEDPTMNRILHALGLVQDQVSPFDRRRLPVKQALEFAVARGPEFIRNGAKVDYIKNNVNGWNLYFKDIGFYGADYRRRAMVAMLGVGANLPKDAVYAPAFMDAGGLLLNGSERYRLHFNREQLPPVNAFWSITVYDERGYLAANPIHRYAISAHLNPLQYNPDCSLDIWISSMKPPHYAEANWLPAPKGQFNLTLRMYWPDSAVLTGQWIPPAVWKI